MREIKIDVSESEEVSRKVQEALFAASDKITWVTGGRRAIWLVEPYLTLSKKSKGGRLAYLHKKSDFAERNLEQVQASDIINAPPERLRAFLNEEVDSLVDDEIKVGDLEKTTRSTSVKKGKGSVIEKLGNRTKISVDWASGSDTSISATWPPQESKSKSIKDDKNGEVRDYVTDLIETVTKREERPKPPPREAHWTDKVSGFEMHLGGRFG